MAELTKITNKVLRELQEKSDDPVYQEDAREVFLRYREFFPEFQVDNVNQMRAILAEDVIHVRMARKRFFIILAVEEDILDEINRQRQKINRWIRKNKRGSYEEN